MFDPHPGRDAVSLQDTSFLSSSPTVSTLFIHVLACRLMGTDNFMRNTFAFLPKSARSHYSKRYIYAIVLDLNRQVFRECIPIA